jgi:hypothetical protein
MDVQSLIRQAAATHGVDPAYLLRTAQLESSLNPSLANPRSSAKGLFQFVDSTRARYGNFAPYDAGASADAGARLARDNAAMLARGLGRQPTNAELYLAHQQGGAGALKILSNPQASAASLVGHDAVRLNGGRPDMTAGDFAGLWQNKFGGAAGNPSLGMSPGRGSNPVSPEVPAAAPPMPPEMPMMPPPDLFPPAPVAQTKQPKQRSLDLGKLFADLGGPSLAPA